MEKLPPHDLDAEEAVIGSLLIDGTSIDLVTGMLADGEAFYYEPNRVLYEGCLALERRKEAIDQITLAQELQRQGKLEQCGGAGNMSRLVSIVPTSLDIVHYAQIVYRLSISRRLMEAGRKIELIGQEANPDVEGSLSRAESILFALQRSQTPGGFVHIRDVLSEYLDARDPASSEYNTPIAQVQSGFTGLDEMLGGLASSDMVVVAGRPSMGKTNLALNVARNIAVGQGAGVGIFSIEMSRHALMLRLLSSESGVPLSGIRLGNITTDEEERRVIDAVATLSEAPIYIDDSPLLRIPEMRSRARRLASEHGIRLIILDHMGLVDGQIKDRVQEISQVSRSIKMLAREMDIPVIVVSQLSRAAEHRASHVPQLSDLRDSGSIEQDADVVLFIYRDEYYYQEPDWRALNPDKPYPAGIADIIIAKHRNGPTGMVKMGFVPKLARFESLGPPQGG